MWCLCRWSSLARALATTPSHPAASRLRHGAFSRALSTPSPDVEQPSVSPPTEPAAEQEYLDLEKGRRAATWHDIEKAKEWSVADMEIAFTVPLLREYAFRHQMRRTGTKKDLIQRIRTSWGKEDPAGLRQGDLFSSGLEWIQGSNSCNCCCRP